MALWPITIRFAPDAIKLVREAAGKRGISVAQFVREASLMRAMVEDGPLQQDFKTLAQEIRHLARDDD